MADSRKTGEGTASYQLNKMQTAAGGELPVNLHIPEKEKGKAKRGGGGGLGLLKELGDKSK